MAGRQNPGAPTQLPGVQGCQERHPCCDRRAMPAIAPRHWRGQAQPRAALRDAAQGACLADVETPMRRDLPLIEVGVLSPGDGIAWASAGALSNRRRPPALALLGPVSLADVRSIGAALHSSRRA